MANNDADKLREILKGGTKNGCGTWVQSPSPDVCEYVSSYFSFVVIDLEHGAIDRGHVPNMVRAIKSRRCIAVARLLNSDPDIIKSILDSGVSGIILPNVKSAAQLRGSVEAACWPPRGKRGVGFSKANMFGLEFETYKNSEAISPVIIAQIESKEGLEDLEDILKVDALDGVIVGPYDLSASLNLLADFDNPVMEDALDFIIHACNKRQIPVGLHVVTPLKAEYEKAIARGFSWIALGTEFQFLRYGMLQAEIVADAN